jgi:hypothetical protein
MVKVNDTKLQEILQDINSGAVRLPDFQRGWVWDDERIRSFIASIVCSYPVGALMFLQCGGKETKFATRTVTNAPEQPVKDSEYLVLDGQQRLTSAYCAMFSREAVPVTGTKNEKKQEFRYYYLDINKCLEPSADLEDAVLSVPGDKIKKYYRSDVRTDLSSPAGEYASHMYPLNHICSISDTNKWCSDYRKHHDYDEQLSLQLDKFNEKILNPVWAYTLPVIQLGRDTELAAVCQVFEKVNTGGVQLTVFELITASFAAGNYNLRKDWEDRNENMIHSGGTCGLLSCVSNTDFLSSMTLLSQKLAHNTLSVKRKDILQLDLADYKNHADKLTNGYIQAAQFLAEQSILGPHILPYPTQLIPLSVIMALLENRSKEAAVRNKIATWLWCGVLGELYSSANETRYANDVADVLGWAVNDDAKVPDTVSSAFFQPIRLLSLKTRNSAAYKGLIALILQNGAKDFKSGSKMDFAYYAANNVDIHHIFPKKYCQDSKINLEKCDCIVNKTPISGSTNKSIGSNAPSIYMEKMRENDIKSHGIDPEALKTDDFDTFFFNRAKWLISLISMAMGKQVEGLSSPEVIRDFGRALE